MSVQPIGFVVIVVGFACLLFGVRFSLVALAAASLLGTAAALYLGAERSGAARPSAARLRGPDCPVPAESADGGNSRAHLPGAGLLASICYRLRRRRCDAAPTHLCRHDYDQCHRPERGTAPSTC